MEDDDEMGTYTVSDCWRILRTNLPVIIVFYARCFTQKSFAIFCTTSFDIAALPPCARLDSSVGTLPYARLKVTLRYLLSFNMLLPSILHIPHCSLRDVFARRVASLYELPRH